MSETPDSPEDDPFAGFELDEETAPEAQAAVVVESPVEPEEAEDPFAAADAGPEDGKKEEPPAEETPAPEEPEAKPTTEEPEKTEATETEEPVAEEPEDEELDFFAQAAAITETTEVATTQKESEGDSLFPETEVSEKAADPFGAGEERMSEKAYVKDTFEAELPVSDDEFDLSDAEASMSRTFMVYGDKGDGKTVVGLSIILATGITDETPYGTDTIYAFSFDRQTKKIVDDFYAYVDEDAKHAFLREAHEKEEVLTDHQAAIMAAKRPEFLERMKVKDGIRYLRKTSAVMWMESAVVSLRYLNVLLARDLPEFDPDWVMIDGLEMMVRDICEMSMRCRNNLPAFSGVELNLWKERNMYVDDIFLQCAKFAKKGVVVTAYVNEKAVEIKGGRIIEVKRKPKWAANVRTQVGNVIRVDGKDGGDDGRVYTAYVESAKYMKLKTGIQVEVTGNAESGEFRGFKEMFDQSKGVEAF